MFGDYRAEWRPDLFASLFIRPTYFGNLESRKPCVLVGGRGTGKTTALKSLRYDATASRLRLSVGGRLPYLGVYLRINKNRVRAFQGAGLDKERWIRLFSHYFNLLVVSEFTRLYLWLVDNEHWPRPNSESLRDVAETLGLTGVDSLEALAGMLRSSLNLLELHVNNIGKSEAPVVSMPEAPIRAFVDMFMLCPELNGRHVYCCVDEYENLLALQQAVVNTYVKHCELPLSYKVGVRRYGIRSRHTLDASDLLRAPEDYDEIDVSTEEGVFEGFALEIASIRLRRANELGVAVDSDIGNLLLEYSRREEALVLGASEISERVIGELRALGRPEVIKWAEDQRREDLYFLRYWAEAGGESIEELALDWMGNPERWVDRLNNYGYASLFWLSKGRKGVRIRKYYCGIKTFLSLSSGNIRYFLELVDESILRHFAASQNENGSQVRISQREQTEAARTVAKRRLEQLEGLSEHGAALKRLVLGLGKVFFEFARSPQGHTPEVSSFVLGGDQDKKSELLPIMYDGVGHLALEATPRTKATSVLEMKDDEFRLHPIFCPFFEFSHRKKRRVTFRAEWLLLLAGDDPSSAMSNLLRGRDVSSSEELPEQLAMFSAFYEGGGER
ncbi:ORC-CDC6 family AAA ATPase [Corallococcus silvisoli]